jgi:hypothetical protein
MVDTVGIEHMWLVAIEIQVKALFYNVVSFDDEDTRASFPSLGALLQVLGLCWLQVKTLVWLVVPGRACCTMSSLAPP